MSHSFIGGLGGEVLIVECSILFNMINETSRAPLVSCHLSIFALELGNQVFLNASLLNSYIY